MCNSPHFNLTRNYVNLFMRLRMYFVTRGGKKIVNVFKSESCTMRFISFIHMKKGMNLFWYALLCAPFYTGETFGDTFLAICPPIVLRHAKTIKKLSFLVPFLYPYTHTQNPKRTKFQLNLVQIHVYWYVFDVLHIQTQAYTNVHC